MLIRGGKLLISYNNFLSFDKSTDLLKIVVLFIELILIEIVKNNQCLFVNINYKHLLKKVSEIGSISELARPFIKFFKNRS